MGIGLFKAYQITKPKSIAISNREKFKKPPLSGGFFDALPFPEIL